MLQAIKNYFDENLSETQAPSDHELALAAAALLFEVSRSDYTIDEQEREKIRHLVEDYFELSAEETETLLKLAEQEAEHSTSLHGFTSLINEHWSLEQRIHLVEHMWQVAYADEQLDDHEIHLMRKIASLLYIPHKQAIAAKLRATKDS